MEAKTAIPLTLSSSKSFSNSVPSHSEFAAAYHYPKSPRNKPEVDGQNARNNVTNLTVHGSVFLEGFPLIPRGEINLLPPQLGQSARSAVDKSVVLELVIQCLAQICFAIMRAGAWALWLKDK